MPIRTYRFEHGAGALVMTDLDLGFERPLGEKEVAELLGVSANTLKHWRWVGKGPRYVKLVSKVAYRRCDLEEWINSNVTEPGCPM